MWFKRALKKYGKDKFTKKILITIKFNQEKLNDLETRLINRYNACDKKIGYNCLPSHAEGFSGVNPTQVPEIMERLILAQQKRWKGKKGKKGIEAKKKVSLQVKEFFESDEGKLQKERLSEIAKENWQNPEILERFKKSIKEFWDSDRGEENREKISGIFKDLWQDEEWRNKQSISRVKAWEDDSRKEAFSERSKVNWKRKEWKDNFKEKMNSYRQSEKGVKDSENFKKRLNDRWKDPEFVKRHQERIQGSKWINNTVIMKKLFKGQEMPEGFSYGKLKQNKS